MNSQHNKSIQTVNQFLQWTKELGGLRVLYRGLSNSAWKLEASAYRRLKEEGKTVRTEEFQKSIVTLLDRASRLRLRNRHGKRYSDLELLAELQHYGAATCLIDFTTDPLIALWFSCYTKPKKNGKVCAMSTEYGNIFVEINEAFSYKELRKKSIEDFFKDREWWKWNPEHQNDRVLAQKSAFIFGKAEIEEKYYKTIEIDHNAKKEIMEELKNNHGITEKYLFNDFAAFVLSNAHDKPFDDYSTDDHLYFGFMSLESENYDDAKRHFSNVIESHTDEDKENKRNLNLFYAYLGRGDVEYALGNMQSATTDYDKAIEIIQKFKIEVNPNFAWVYNNRGNVKYELEDCKGAIKDYDKAVDINPNLIDTYNNRGIAKDELEDYQGAIIDFEKVIELDSNYADAYNNRGNVKYELEDYKGAIKDYDKAIEINPNYAAAYNNRGTANDELEDHQGALRDFEKAIEINPNFSAAYNNRGNVRYKLEDHQGAIKDYDKAVEINPYLIDTYNNRGISKDELEDHQGALKDFEKAIEINPNFSAAYNNSGTVNAKLKNYESALRDFEKAIELDPNCADAYNNRGNVKYEQEDYKGAIKDYDKAIEINPNFTEAYKNRGRTKKKLDGNHGAEEDLNKAQKLEQQPTD